MTALFAAQLQPWEENQSPSPTETNQNPYELALARSRSSSSKSGQHNHTKSLSSPSSIDSHSQGHNSNSKPPSPINTLHRQLSGDPEAPPPAWKRRASVNGKIPSSGPPSASRRHPGLQMTLSTGLRQPLPDQMFLHESPNSSSTDLAELGLPQPAFATRRRSNASGISSNRSSMHSLTSEELWKMDQEANQPDLSNPTRQAKERPLDTVRRMSRTFEQPTINQLPGEVIWPSAMDESPSPAALRSRSTTSITKIASKKLTIRKKSSRNQSFDTTPNDGVYLHSQTVSPNSFSRPESMIITSSAHSSTTSLNSQGFSPLKMTGNRPPSAYYSRDFLSSLAPREGGYAIAATMGNGLGAHGTMSVDERRRSQVPDMNKRAPMAKSAGMGRWSLDGGEHYAKPYGTPSAATTSSNLSGPPLTSPEISPPMEESRLPEGASAPVSQSLTPQSTDQSQTTTPAIITMPTNPSPLSQHTTADDEVVTPHAERAPPSASASAPALGGKKSKRDLAKEAKAQKLEAQKAEHIRKAEEKAAAIKAKADKKQAEAKAKEDAKRKEKEEKERRKAEKKAKKAGPAPAAAIAAPQRTGTQVPFPRTSAPTAPGAATPVAARQKAQSMPLHTIPPSISTTNQGVKNKNSESTLKTQATQSQKKLGFLGTLKKRLSGPSTSLADVRRRQASDAENLASMPRPTAAQAVAPPTPVVPEVRSSSMVAGSSIPPAPTQDFAPSSALVMEPSSAAGVQEPTQPEVQVSSPTPPITTDIPAPVPTTSPSPSSRSLAKVASRDTPSVRSGRSSSLRGPRPMPQSSSTRPESITVPHSQPPTTITATSGFPFMEVETPATSAESSMFSNTTLSQSGHGHGDVSNGEGSPFTSIDSQSRKNSLDEADELERNDSTTPKASEETEVRAVVA